MMILGEKAPGMINTNFLTKKALCVSLSFFPPQLLGPLSRIQADSRREGGCHSLRRMDPIHAEHGPQAMGGQ